MSNSEAQRGKRAVVTGGCGGMGKAICRRLAAEGATVIACDIAGTDEATPEGITHRHLDVTDEESVVAFSQGLGNEPVDILVNAAGIEIEKTIEDTTLAEWNRIFAINVTAMFLVSKHLLGCLRRSKGASIINFGSYDGFIADPGLAAYCATKGAVHALTRALACDYGPEGIRVNAICPGYIDTPMLQSFFQGLSTLKALNRRYVMCIP
jgi:NAD(P)-dependent dehydrogenase (short-subunit alcohol dehydrogenase family)